MKSDVLSPKDWKVFTPADAFAEHTWADADMDKNFKIGYRKGWKAATSLAFDLLFMGRQEAYDILFDHSNNGLLDWIQVDGSEPPPNPPKSVCVYCGLRRAEHMDHVIPKSRGGSDEPSNLVPSCAKCNIQKRDRTPEEWLG